MKLKQTPSNDVNKPGKKLTGSTRDALVTNLQQNFVMTTALTGALLDRIAHMEQEHEFYSLGFQSKVYKVDVDTPLGHKHFLILKKRNKGNKSGNEVVQEYEFHSKAKNLLKNRPDIAKHIDVPIIWAIMKDAEGSDIMVMDYIDGETIFAHNVAAVIPIVYNELQAKLGSAIKEHIAKYDDNLFIGSDYALKKYAIKLFRVFCRYADETKYAPYFMLAKEEDFVDGKDGKLLEEKINKIATAIYEKYVTSTIDPVWKQEKKDAAFDMIGYFHENGVYHNDVTSRNIIKGDDGKMWLIDFGNATSAHKPDSAIRKATSPASDVRSHLKYNGKTLEKDYKMINMIDKL